MNPETILRKEDCEVPRTAEELIAWIESVHAQFDADDATRNYARMGKGLLKPFHEEIVPLGNLAHHKYLEKPDFYLRPKIGNQIYDAEIIDKSSGDENIARVEFVNTYRDHNLALRLEYLGQHGGVAMTGPVWRDGTKASGAQVHVVLDCVNHQAYLDNLIITIKDRMADKLGKPYPADTIIAVVFDDYSLNPENDLPQLQLYFRDTLSKEALRKFSGLFIIGASGRTFWEFGETAPPYLPR